MYCHYDLGSGNEMLTLPFVNVSDGRWHVVRFNRYGNQATLRLDGGEGRNYAERMPDDTHRWLFVNTAYGAADVYYKNRYHRQNHTPVISNAITESECLHLSHALSLLFFNFYRRAVSFFDRRCKSLLCMHFNACYPYIISFWLSCEMTSHYFSWMYIIMCTAKIMLILGLRTG